MKEIVIIGGGPSGIVCALHAKRKNNEVIILEKNKELLKKLLITGNGKCNYFNDEIILDNYESTNKEQLEDIITNENIDKVRDFFDRIGIIPKIKNGYWYPYSNQATTIKEQLELELRNKNIKVYLDSEVKSVTKEKDKFIIKYNNEVIKCDVVVVSTGSKAYPKTGSDGFGYDLLKYFGHTIIKPLPALVQLETKNKYKDWSGVRTDVELELFEDDKYISKEKGELQLTEYGISGICVFNLSNKLVRGLDEGKKEVIKISFVPLITNPISIWLNNYNKKNENKTIKELLEGFLNSKIVKVLLKFNNIDENTKYNELNNEMKIKLINSLRFFKMEIKDTKGFDNSQICNGGVSILEVNSNTFESLKVKGLYIVGELLDINGNCGGYNLINCWISGILSGTNIGDNND